MNTHFRRRVYSPHRPQRPLQYFERSHRFTHHRSRSRSPPYSHRTFTSYRANWSERGIRDSSGRFSRGGLKRPREAHVGLKHPDDDLSKSYADDGHAPSSSATGLSSKKGTTKSKVKTSKTAVKPPLVKKKKKTITAAPQATCFAKRLVYLTGIPTDATEQEVTDLVGSFGKINNVILMACSEEDSEKDQGQKASVCMVTAKDAQALASCPQLCIRQKEITASVAEKTEDGACSDANNKPAPDQDKAEGDPDNKDDQKCKVLITGLPASGWSESDIVQLVQSFETPSNIIVAQHIGKALVSLPDLEVAEEMVKVHKFTPAKINDSEVKLTLVKQHINLNTPVALYNIFMGSVDPLKTSGLVGWESLLIIRNVPDTQSGSSEVLKLVRRFGTVIKTLVLSNMVICEMATASMAVSVYKRFRLFPCIIQSNPLFFSRKPDPKVRTQTKVIAAYQDPSEDKPANGGSTQMEAEDMTHEEKSEPPMKGTEEDEKIEKTAEDESLGDNDDCVNKEERVICESPAAPDAAMEMKETSSGEEKKDVALSEEGNDSTSVKEESQAPQNEAPQQSTMPELPKMTQAMVNALLVECRTRTAGLSKKTAAPPAGKPQEAQVTEETAKQAKESATQEEEEVEEEQQRDRKDRDPRKEKEVKERERRENEWRAWEKERVKRAYRVKRAKKRAEKTRREWERRVRERTERKRSYDQGGTGSRSSYRSEGYRQTSWRDEQYDGEAESRKVEDEDFEDFPFNMSDFVTVDEVGDVAELPSVTVATETPPEGHLQQKDAPEVTPPEVSVTQENSDEQISKSDDVSEPIVEISDGLTSNLDQVPSGSPAPPCQPEEPMDEAGCGPSTISHSDLDQVPSGSSAPPCQPEEPMDEAGCGPDSELTAGLDVGPVLVLADSSSNSPAGVMAYSETDNSLFLASGEPEDEAEAENLEMAEDASNSEEKSEKTEVTMTTEQPLPPYDPSKAVGLEYLVPKTGFFCKVCTRFFSGDKVAEIKHCKTLKHYENLQKFLQTD